MGQIVAEFPSKSHPGKYYHISIPNGGGEPYCDCWGWKRNRTCMHLEVYKAQTNPFPKLSPSSSETTIKKYDKIEPKVVDFDAEIANAVNNIINKS